MEKPAFYLAFVVLLQTASECSGLEWEFGSNLSGSKTILEKDGIIPSYLQEKRISIGKPKCTDVVYVKVEVEGMPSVTYNIDLTMVVIKFEKGHRTKNSEFRVTAKGVKSEGPKCGGTTPKPTGYPEGENPFHDVTPHFQFSNEYLARDEPTNNALPNHAPPNNAFSNDAYQDDAPPNNAFSNNAHPDDAPPNNAFSNDAHQDDAPPNNAFPNDARPDDSPQYDA